MKYNLLGKTQMNISAIGFGGIPIQRVSLEEAIETIKACVNDNGINFIDTARGYGISENYIGAALKQIDKKVFVATKAMAYTYSEMQKQISLSLATLNIPTIDLYQIHSVRTIETLNTAFGDNGAYSALLEAKSQGKIKHIGITSHSVDTLIYAVKHYNEKIETIMYPYNIVESQGIEMFKLCKQYNIGTIAMKPLGGGNIDDTKLAIRYVLDNDYIDCALVGMGNAAEVKADVVDDFSSLTNAEIQACDTIKSSLTDNFCRRCGYCLPCPNGLDIPTIFTMQNYVRKYNLKEWASSRYFALKSTAKDCVECGLCETRCPYNLPIRKKLKSVKKDFNE